MTKALLEGKQEAPDSQEENFIHPPPHTPTELSWTMERREGVSSPALHRWLSLSLSPTHAYSPHRLWIPRGEPRGINFLEFLVNHGG